MPVQPSDVIGRRVTSRSKTRLAAALTVHILMLPVWFVEGAVVASGAAANGSEAAAWVMFGCYCAGWLLVSANLVRWWRQGRDESLWKCPLIWGIALFLWPLLFRRVRSGMVPPRAALSEQG